VKQCSKAFPVNDGGAGLIIFLLGDPHLLECAQGREDGTTDPYRVLPLRWCHYLDLHCRWSKSCQLLRHTLSNTLEHGSASGKNNVCIEVLANIHITFHDRLECSVMNPTGFLTDEAWLEQNFRAAEAFIANSDDVAIWKFTSSPCQNFHWLLSSHYQSPKRCMRASLSHHAQSHVRLWL